MIGPGWLPGYRPGAPKKHTLAYTRLRRRSRRRQNKEVAAARPAHTDLVLFDQGPSELPVATAVPREPRARAIALVADVQRWFAARWQWFRPRTVPCVVAGLGMLAVIASADYLANHHGNDDVKPARVVHIDMSPR